MDKKKAAPTDRPQNTIEGNSTYFPAWIQEKLQSSGIPLQIAQDAGIRPVVAEEAARLLGRDFRKKPCPDAFKIPYFRLDGHPLTNDGKPYFRLRFRG